VFLIFKHNKIEPDAKDAFIVLAITMLVLIILPIAIGDRWGKPELVFLELFVLFPVLFYVFIYKLPVKTTFRLKKTSFPILAAAGFIGLCLGIVVDEMNRLVQMVFPMQKDIWEALKSLFTWNSGYELSIILIAAVIIGPLAEELLFRGFTQQIFEKKKSVTSGIMTTSLLFALVHFNPWGLIQILVLGVILGFITWKTGTVFPAVILHGVYNGLSILMLNVSPQNYGWYFWGSHVAPQWIVLGIAGTVAGILLIYRMTHLSA